MKDQSRTAKKRIAECQKHQSRQLDMTGLQLKEFPMEFFDCDWLEEAYLLGIPVNAYPDHFHKLPLLKELCLGNSLEIVELPKSVHTLHLLNRLVLSVGSQAAQLPNEWESLTQLQTLLLDGPIASFPQCIRGMRSLKKLTLRNMLIEKIPDWIGELGFLERIIVENCRLVQVPEGLRHLDKLTSIEIRGCPYLESLPNWIGELASLQAIWASNCSIRSLPASLINNATVREIRIPGNPLGDEFWSLQNTAEDEWIRWHGKKCYIGHRPPQSSRYTVNFAGEVIFKGEHQQCQCFEKWLLVTQSSTKHIVIDTRQQLFVELDLTKFTNFSAQSIEDVQCCMLEGNRVLFDIALLLPVGDNFRCLLVVDSLTGRVVAESWHHTKGRNLWPPIRLQAGLVALDLDSNERALLFDTTSFKVLGLLYNDAENAHQFPHNEHELLHGLALGTNSFLCHWGEIGESLFEEYQLEANARWLIHASTRIQANEIESMALVNDEVIFAEVWMDKSVVELSIGFDLPTYQIGTIRSLGGGLPAIPLLCLSPAGLVDMTEFGLEGIGVARFNPALTPLSQTSFAYLDPIGNVIEVIMPSSQRLLKQSTRKAYRQLVRGASDLYVSNGEEIIAMKIAQNVSN